MTGRRLSHWFLPFVAMLAVFGHICALPFHAHAGIVTTHESHSAEHDEHSAGGHDEQSHLGSCEMLRAVSAYLAVVIVAAGPVLLPPLDTQSVGVWSPAAILTSVSPPLFLLHASLLI
jgi:hypothetical protein